MRKLVVKLIQGKKLIGYHLPQKMADFGLLDVVTSKEGSGSETQLGKPWTAAFDIAKIFNATNAAQQQPLATLCEKYLNLNYKKRPAPFFAVSY
jgi:hypothetical protein